MCVTYLHRESSHLTSGNWRCKKNRQRSQGSKSRSLGRATNKPRALSPRLERWTPQTKQGSSIAPSVSFSAQAHNSWEPPASLVSTELPCSDSSSNLFQKHPRWHITMLYQPSGQPSGGFNSKHPHNPLSGTHIVLYLPVCLSRLSVVDGCSSERIIPLS